MGTVIPHPSREAMSLWVRWLLTISAWVVLSAAMVLYFVDSQAVLQSRLIYNQSQLSNSPIRIDPKVIQRAIASAPLEQKLLNIAMVSRTPATSSLREPWIAVLRQMGWRDASSLQNILVSLSKRGDVPGIVNILDALLRSGQLFEQAATGLGIMEALPEGRPYVIHLLQRHPAWRHDYLVTAGQILTEPAALGRLSVLLDLERRGDDMSRDEIAPLLPVLIRFHHPLYAWTLWRGFTGASRLSSPLNDPDFRLAAAGLDTNQIPVPFEWNFPNGSGYSTDPYLNQGRAQLTIQWDGRDSPTFATQLTSSGKSNYGLILMTLEQPTALNSLLAFRFRCGDKEVDFEPDTNTHGRTVSLRTRAPVPCVFPTFEITGRPQETSPSRSVTILGIRLFSIKS